MHHTGKPTADPRAKSHWTGSDMAYSGLGSSALTNWAREVAVLTRVKTPDGMPLTFRFELCKRRRRAGMTDMLGNPTEGIYVRHGDTGICWQQCADPTPPEKEKPSGATYTIGKKGGGRPKARPEPIPEFDSITKLSREQESELSVKYEISISTVRRRWREHLKGKTTNES